MQVQDTDFFAKAEWTKDFSGVEGMPWGMLNRNEASLLYHLSRGYYRGYGEVIDAGAFLGASSYCLARGLAANTGIEAYSGRLHAYDAFVVWVEAGGDKNAMADALKKNYGIDVSGGQSFLMHYMKNVGDLARHIDVHVGDFLKQRWDGRPIEVLFVDICKSQALMQHLVAEMYRSLIPGVSVVVHQDYHHPLCPWIHVIQAHLADYFEIVVGKADASRAYRLVRPIPDSMLDTAARFDFSPVQQVTLMDAAVNSVNDGQSHHLKLARVVLLNRVGWTERAKAALAETEAAGIPDNRASQHSLKAAYWALRLGAPPAKATTAVEGADTASVDTGSVDTEADEDRTEASIDAD